MNTYRIENPPTLDQILSRVVAVEVELRKRGIEPARVLVGPDLYLVIEMRVRERQAYAVALDASGTESLRGLILLCDPLLSPMELRVIGRNEDNAYRAARIREANAAATAKEGG